MFDLGVNEVQKFRAFKDVEGDPLRDNTLIDVDEVVHKAYNKIKKLVLACYCFIAILPNFLFNSSKFL